MLSMVHSRDFGLVILINYSRLKVIDPSTFEANFRALSEFDMPENIPATCGWVRKAKHSTSKMASRLEPFLADHKHHSRQHGNMFWGIYPPWKLTVSPPITVVSNRNLLFQGSIFRGYVSFRVLKVIFLRSLPYNMMLGLGWSINAVVPRQIEGSLDQKQDESLGLQWPLSQPKFGAEDDVIDAISNPTCRDTNQIIKSPNFIWKKNTPGKSTYW